MLHHACCYQLANDGHESRAIQAIWVLQNSEYEPLYGLGATTVQGVFRD
jgi:hypothetical protein